MNEVSRQEQKYLVTLADCRQHSDHFARILHQDVHNGSDGYIIRSLYFDTLDNRDWQDKVDGAEVRRKIRLRLYDPSGDFAMLEMKQKHGSRQLKRSLRLCREDAIALAEGCYTPLLKQNGPFALECYALMQTQLYRPKTVIEYRRMAFIGAESTTRITFDTQIRASESCFDLFSPQLILCPVLDPWLAVMEVKYGPCLLSYIQDAINSINKNALSISKYCLGRSFSLHFTF